MTGGKGRWIAAAVILATAALTTAVLVYNRQLSKSLANDFYIPRAPKLTANSVLLQQYVRVNTTNPPGNETAGAQFLAQQLAAAGIHSEIIESAPGRGNLYARIRGRNAGDALLLLNHIDVVPPNGKWSRPPFSGDVLLNMIYGRGAIDMKGVAICELQAFIAVAHSGRKPEHDLVFLAVADEEEGGALGTRWLLDHRPDVFDGVRYALNEGGITEMKTETLTYFGIETGSDQTTTVNLAASSREALDRARMALEPFAEPLDADRVLPGVRRYLKMIARTRIETRETLEDIDHTLAIGKFWLIPPMYHYLLANTVRAFGAVPSQGSTWTMTVYLFNLPDEDPDRRLEWLAKTVEPFGVRVANVVEKQGPAPISSDDTPLFAIIGDAVRAEFGAVPFGPIVLPLSASDSRFLRARGIVCYGLQPFKVDFFQSGSIHGIDERVRIDWFESGVKLMTRVVQRYAFGH